MRIFGKIRDAIFGHKLAAPAPAPAPSPAASTATQFRGQGEFRGQYT